MKITIARYYNYEGWYFEDFDTENQHDMSLLIDTVKEIAHGSDDVKVVQELEPSVETLGEELYSLYLAKKKNKEAARKGNLGDI